jgi:hypothetical protein
VVEFGAFSYAEQQSFALIAPVLGVAATMVPL